MKTNHLELYTDYLMINAAGYATATGLSTLMEGEVSHDQITRLLRLAKSPTRTVTTQNNHVFMSIYAVFKLECLNIIHKTNHFALRAKFFIRTTQQAYTELQNLRTA